MTPYAGLKPDRGEMRSSSTAKPRKPDYVQNTPSYITLQ
jgi:hypothetical protein